MVSTILFPSQLLSCELFAHLQYADIELCLDDIFVSTLKIAQKYFKQTLTPVFSDIGIHQLRVVLPEHVLCLQDLQTHLKIFLSN